MQFHIILRAHPFDRVREAMQPDGRENIALHRAVWHSSAKNADEVGHLVTDGIVEQTGTIPDDACVFEKSPAALESDGAFFGGQIFCVQDKFAGSGEAEARRTSFTQLDLYHSATPVAVTAYTVCGATAGLEAESLILSGSDDGETFTELDRQSGVRLGEAFEAARFPLGTPPAYRHYRLTVMAADGARRVETAQWRLLDAGGREMASCLPKTFISRWVSGSNSEESLTVDLGDGARFDEARLYWGDVDYAAHYRLEASDDRKRWRKLAEVEQLSGGTHSLPFGETAARYLRLSFDQCAGERYALYELEVLGSASGSRPEIPAQTAAPTAGPTAKGDALRLSGGGWLIRRADEVDACGEELTGPEAETVRGGGWLPATVPGTALTSYLRWGAVADPNFGDQQRQVSDSYFTTDYWYCKDFLLPASEKGRHVLLDFDAVNWKADVYLNGGRLGRIDGAFIRGRFDVTGRVRFDGPNRLAVYIHRNDNPGEVREKTLEALGPNGGVLGRDNPTIHPSISWDWVPCVRGRNVGIYEDVWLRFTGGLRLGDGYVETKLPAREGAPASAAVCVEVENLTKTAQTATVRGKIQPGGPDFTETVRLEAGEVKLVSIPVTIEQPKLWWPNGYGEPFLYAVSLEAFCEGGDSPCDHKRFRFGIREFRYSETGPLEVYVNNVRIFCCGGNWGMDDQNLAATPEEYELKVRLHAEEHFTMIRNWVGQTRHDAFYDACDKYGILIWDDFWLANPADGPNPADREMFRQNAADKLKRNRHHASVALHCGRNEGMPPPEYDLMLRELVAAYDPERKYIPESAENQVSGYGPYVVQDPKWYFGHAPKTLHSERGMPNVPALESVQEMLPEKDWWPMNDRWGMHDFVLGTMQSGVKYLAECRRYGCFDDLPSFVRFAQMVNYENHKAMLESFAANDSNGLLLWMSMSAWPSMVWQTFDYYYDTGAGYFGCKTACQPVHPIWNPLNDEILLANHTARPLEDVRVVCKVYNLDGTETNRMEATGSFAPSEVRPLFTAQFPESGWNYVKLIRLSAYDRDGEPLGENFYWTNIRYEREFSALDRMPRVNLTAKAVGSEALDGGRVRYTVRIHNDSGTPALLIRLKTLDPATGKRVLPAYYEDNYFSLMPGEEKTVRVEFAAPDTDPAFWIEGFNIELKKL